MRTLTHIFRTLRSPKKILQALSYITKDEDFWDAYADDGNLEIAAVGRTNFLFVVFQKRENDGTP